jgi:hypothetical protein
VGPENDRFIAEAIGPDSVVVCAWGANQMADQRHAKVVDTIAARGAQPKCLGKTRAGYPRHPLYVRGDTKLACFDG